MDASGPFTAGVTDGASKCVVASSSESPDARGSGVDKPRTSVLSFAEVVVAHVGAGIRWDCLSLASRSRPRKDATSSSIARLMLLIQRIWAAFAAGFARP